jgi:4-diphosphocytidyl-2C-methyl-D-erythritol kinase
LDLKQIAFEIGSDVPFFILGKEWAKVTNYGDKITPIQKHKYNWKIILTNIPNSTKQTFKKLDHDQKYKSKAKERLCNISPKNNDLQPYAFAINKKLKAKYEELQQKFTIVMLLGSGGSFLVQKPKTKLSD